jgi:ribonuclease Z
MAENQERADETAAALQRTDRITTVLSGTASPLANEGAQTCTAVFVNGQFLLFDVGDGAMASIRASMLPQDELDAVFITHYHNDHYADLGEAMQWSWIQGRRHILPVHGPTGITQIVESFEAAYELEATYRTAHHGAELMPPEWVDSEPVAFAQPEGDAAPVVYDRNGVVVKAFRANHEPVDPAVGYRIEFEDNVVVISGDTLRTTALLEHSQNADLLVAEAMNKDVVQAMERAAEELGDTVNATLLFDIQDYHMDIREVGVLATEANVQRLALNHLAPKPQGDQEATRIFEDPVKESYSGELFVGEDGMQIIVPVE